MNDDEFHKMMSVDDLTYSTAYSDVVIDYREWHTYAGLEICNVTKSTRHGNELLGMSIQSATERGNSGNDNLAYLSGDDIRLGTDHTKVNVYESSNDMSVGNSISENQIESDSDLEDDLFFLAKDDDDLFSDSDDLLADESLEGTLDASFKSLPCTDVSAQTQHKNVGSRSVTELDPGVDLVSSRVPDQSDKSKKIDDFGSFCIFDEMPVEPCDNEVILSSPIDFVSSFTDAIDYA